MRRKALLLIVAMGAADLALLMITIGQASPSDIFGSEHDLGSVGNPTCKQCHIPHRVRGAYLWARTPGGPLPGSAMVCYSCHDGSIAVSGTYIWAARTVNHQMGAEGDGGMKRYHDGYCVACHDAHDPDWRFTWDVMRMGKPENPDNAMVCLACHGLPSFDPAHEENHPWEILMSDRLPTDQTFDPDENDWSGTRLWDDNLKEPVAAGSPGKITCLSCHSVHGAASANDTLISMASYQPVLVDSGYQYHEPICENCH